VSTTCWPATYDETIHSLSASVIWWRGHRLRASRRSLAESHIRANVPDEKDFDKFLKRDIEKYFKDTKQKSITVEYELLRDGRTQSGIAYPKFYAWVTVRDGATIVDQGAVRVAAVQKKLFKVTHFVSEADIKRAPAALDEIFPLPVADKIRERVLK